MANANFDIEKICYLTVLRAYMKKSDKFCWICPIFCKKGMPTGDKPLVTGGGAPEDKPLAEGGAGGGVSGCGYS